MTDAFQKSDDYRATMTEAPWRPVRESFSLPLDSWQKVTTSGRQVHVVTPQDQYLTLYRSVSVQNDQQPRRIRSLWRMLGQWARTLIGVACTAGLAVITPAQAWAANGTHDRAICQDAQDIFRKADDMMERGVGNWRTVYQTVNYWRDDAYKKYGRDARNKRTIDRIHHEIVEALIDLREFKNRKRKGLHPSARKRANGMRNAIMNTRRVCPGLIVPTHMARRVPEIADIVDPPLPVPDPDPAPSPDPKTHDPDPASEPKRPAADPVSPKPGPEPAQHWTVYVGLVITLIGVLIALAHYLLDRRRPK